MKLLTRICGIVSAWLLFASIAVAATLLPNGEQVFLDNNGAPLAGGSVYTYIPGTTVTKNTWQDSGQTILNQNPILLDSAGRAIIYGTGTYREIVKDVNGNLIWDQLTADTSASSSSWAGLSSGTPNAQTVTAANFTSNDGQSIGFIAFATNTGAFTLDPNGGTPINVLKDTPVGPVSLSGGEIVAGNQYQAVYDATAGAFHLVAYPQTSSASGSTISTRQTVISGPLSSSAPSFLPSTTASLSISSQNVTPSVPLNLTAANGFLPGGNVDINVSITSNLTWAPLTASTTNYLGLTLSGGVATPFTSTLPPLYQFGGTISTASGQYTFNTQTMQMFVGNGTSAIPVVALFVGQASTSSSAVTSSIAYAYNGYFETGIGPASALTANNVVNSAIGTNTQIVDLMIICVNADSGYSPGDQVINPLTQATGSVFPPVLGAGTRTTSFVRAGSAGLAVLSGGAITVISLGNWNYKIIARRSW